MAAAGLAVGFMRRGALLGLGVPLLAVGMAWGIARASARNRAADRTGDVVGAVSLTGGAVIAVMAARAIAAPDAGSSMSMWAGALLHRPPKYPTYEATLGAVGHALAPWSAFLPFAFGRLLLTPAKAAGAEGERESLARVAVAVGAAVAVIAHGYLAARTEGIAFTGPAICAVACAVAIRDFERGAHASIAVGLGTLVLAAVLHHDFHELPDKAFLAFGVSGATFPAGFESKSVALWWVVLGGFALCALLTWAERDAKRTPFDPATYAAVLRAMRGAGDGTGALVYAATVTGAAVAGLVLFIGARAHAAWLPHMAIPMRDALINAWWVVALAPFALVLAPLFACDLWLWAFGDSRPASARSLRRALEPIESLWSRQAPDPLEGWVARFLLLPLLILALPVLFVMGVAGDLLRHRAAGLALGGAVVGFVLCAFYYPALADQLSPKEVFATYRQACGGKPLALLGVGGKTAAYYAGAQPQTLGDTASAFRWLTAPGGERRCLAMKADELPKLNALWREGAPAPKTNLPVLDARSSQILLATSALAPGDHDDNPLDRLVLASAPRPQRRLDVNLDDKLRVVGLDLTDDRGRLVDAVSPGRTYHLKTTFEVLARQTTEWRPFLHIDGSGRRHNGDHTVLGGKYPMNLWLPGDVVVDDTEVKLEPNFTPGTYTIWFGLAVGDGCSDRLRVKSGPSDGCNRVNGGALRVQ
jgi:hypothetical protein